MRDLKKELTEFKEKLEGRTIKEIKPLFNTRGSFSHFIIILDNGFCLEEQDGEYGGNNLSLYKDETEYLNKNPYYKDKGEYPQPF